MHGDLQDLKKKPYHKGENMYCPVGLSSTMNRSFIKKVNNLKNAIPMVNHDHLNSLWKSMKNRQYTFSMKQLTEEEVTKKITSVNNSSST